MNAVGEKEAWEEVERAVNNVAKKNAGLLVVPTHSPATLVGWTMIAAAKEKTANKCRKARRWFQLVN